MDIVKRLRNPSPPNIQFVMYECMKEAADEIEQLREQARYRYEGGLKKDVEIERLREALTCIERHPVEESKQWEVAVKEMKRLARSALPQKESD